MQTGPPAGVLDQRSFHAIGNARNQRIQAGVVLALPDAASGREHQALLAIRDRGELVERRVALPGPEPHLARQSNQSSTESPSTRANSSTLWVTRMA